MMMEMNELVFEYNSEKADCPRLKKGFKFQKSLGNEDCSRTCM
jgi:hypothetical protein